MSNNAQQQEPVYFCDYGYEGWGKVDADMAAANIADGMTVEAYYTSPPAQRTWVELTEDDKETPDMGKYVFLSDDWIDGYKTGMKQAEAKLKEKNA